MADRLEEILTVFEAFKKGSLQRKKAVKERIISLKEFMGCIGRAILF